MVDFVTHSLLKTFRRCPRAALYRYHDCLAPKMISKPLKRGIWLHELLEAYYSGADWKDVHRTNTQKFSQLMDEEKDNLGDLPYEILKLFRSYLWHYKNDDSWTVHETEFTLEAELPNGIQWQGKADMLVEDEFGLWLVDHKSHSNIPPLTQRMLDQQSIFYLWACQKNGIPVRGFIWNYIKTLGPKDLRLTKAGTIAKNMGPTDFPTVMRELKRQDLDPRDPKYFDFVKNLQKQRYIPGEPQTSIFFQRSVLEKDANMIKRSLKEACTTAERFNTYDFEDRDAVERVSENSCNWCEFKTLCTTELMGGHTSVIKKKEFNTQDPFGYYQPDRER